jgi:chromosomal replication initiation ATPase DnaA
MEKYKKVIKDLVEEKEQVEAILKCASFIHNIPKEQFLTRSRERRLIDMRRMVYAVLRELLNMGYSKIGSIFKINHATVIHHYKQHKIYIEVDRFYRDKFESLLEIVKCELGYVDVDNIIEEARKINEERERASITIKKSIEEL